ncbi:DUF202 domain-containing protein [Candidatus Fermentibacterales bacterium]|nr:DUF202 domain-containing protein [Candidatus Fermentibacterales bacterium]
MSIDHSCDDIRNELARERTVLANERTLLAYARTALMLLASGITLVKFLEVGSDLLALGYVLIGASLLVGIIGYHRFHTTRADLKRVQGWRRPPSGQDRGKPESGEDPPGQKMGTRTI